MTQPEQRTKAARLEIVSPRSLEEVEARERIRMAADAQECYLFSGAMVFIAGGLGVWLTFIDVPFPWYGAAAGMSITAGVYGLVYFLRLAIKCREEIAAARAEIENIHWKGW